MPHGAGPDGEKWTQAAAAVADGFGGLPLDAYCVGRDIEDAGRFAETCEQGGGSKGTRRSDICDYQAAVMV